MHLKQVIRKNINDVLDWVYTNLPAEVVEYFPDTQTATVQPLINYTWADGVVQEDPVIADVPVMFPSAGGGSITFPVERGDTVLLCFSMRSIDSWMEGTGEATTPEENRFHELNDAIAIPGLYPKKKSLKPSAEDVEIKFKGNSVTLKANGDIIIDGGRIELGEGASEAIMLGDAFKTYFDTHTHTCASPGSPTTPPIVPIPPTAFSTKVFTK